MRLAVVLAALVFYSNSTSTLGPFFDSDTTFDNLTTTSEDLSSSTSDPTDSDGSSTNSTTFDRTTTPDDSSMAGSSSNTAVTPDFSSPDTSNTASTDTTSDSTTGNVASASNGTEPAASSSSTPDSSRADTGSTTSETATPRGIPAIWTINSFTGTDSGLSVTGSTDLSTAEASSTPDGSRNTTISSPPFPPQNTVTGRRRNPEGIRTRTLKPPRGPINAANISRSLLSTPDLLVEFDSKLWYDFDNQSVEVMILVWVLFLATLSLIGTLILCSIRIYYKRATENKLEEIRKKFEASRENRALLQGGGTVLEPLSAPVSEQGVYYPLGLLLREDAYGGVL